jgi:hypothetical protein
LPQKCTEDIEGLFSGQPDSPLLQFRTLTTEYTVYQVHHPLTSSQQAAGPHRWAAPAGARTSRGQRTSVQPQNHAMGAAGREPRGVETP